MNRIIAYTAAGAVLGGLWGLLTGKNRANVASTSDETETEDGENASIHPGGSEPGTVETGGNGAGVRGDHQPDSGAAPAGEAVGEADESDT